MNGVSDTAFYMPHTPVIGLITGLITGL